MAVRIRAVEGSQERAEFIDLPWWLYSGDDCWVPPLKSSVRALLDQGKHPFYDDGRAAEVALFLARDGSRPVGRVAAILNHTHNRYWNERVGFFGFFESIDDQEVALSLLDAAEQWARQRGSNRLRGPMNPSTNYECGLLVEGFGRQPVLMMTYNPIYYPRLVEEAGYHKVKDLYAYYSTVHDTGLQHLHRLANLVCKRNPGLRCRPANLRDIQSEIRLVQEIYNSAWQKNWGFVPISDAEIEAMARELRPLVQPDMLRFAFLDDEPVGFILSLPDWNPVLKDLDGSPWRHPLRTLRHMLLTKAQHMEGLRLITLGIKEEYRKRGFEAPLVAESLGKGMRLGYRWAEYSWILEDNELSKRSVRHMDAELYKQYRLYEKTLS
jgi:hypothetical protein